MAAQVAIRRQMDDRLLLAANEEDQSFDVKNRALETAGTQGFRPPTGEL